MRLVALLILVSCTSSPNYWNPYTPIRAQTKLDRDAAVQRAVIAITDAGREVESSTDGIVLSKWFAGDGFGDGQRFRVRVVLTGSDYEIAALCQPECLETQKRPQFVLETMKKIDAGLR
jgi:hypothetical protein